MLYVKQYINVCLDWPRLEVWNIICKKHDYLFAYEDELIATSFLDFIKEYLQSLDEGVRYNHLNTDKPSTC